MVQASLEGEAAEETTYADSPPIGKQIKTSLDGTPGKQVHIASGVDLFTVKNEATYEFEFSVRNLKLAELDFIMTINSKKSQNMGWSGSPGQLEVRIRVPPKTSKSVGRVVPIQPSASCMLSYGLSLSFAPVNKAELKSAAVPDSKVRSKLVEKMRAASIVASKLGSAEALEAACAQAGATNFIDVEFLPNDRALFSELDSPENAVVVWRRPGEFFNGDFAIFSDGIEASDIKQGALGDCWFLSALAALAEYPQLIQTVFGRNRAVSKYGVYELKCYKNGLPITIIVDDYFPCDPSSGNPCYSHAVGNELWVLLLEKAWAKLHGSYQQIEAGRPYRAMMDLCGAPGRCLSIKHDWTKGFFEKLELNDKRGSLMAAGTPGRDDMTKSTGTKPKSGIVPGHAYTLIAAKQKNGVKLFELRNPWGDYEWGGDWSDRSPLWTPAMKAFFQPSLDSHDGRFWISKADFRNYFSDIDIVYERCTMGRKWAEARLQLTTEGSDMCGKIVVLEIDKPAAGFVTLMQRDTRVAGTPDYISVAFAVYGPCDDRGIPSREVLRSDCFADREIVADIPEDARLEPGRYLVVVYDQKQSVNVPLTLVVQLDLDKVVLPTSAISLNQKLRSTLALASAKTWPQCKKSKLGPLEDLSAFMPHNGYVCAVRNTDPIAMTVDFKFNESQGMRLINGHLHKNITFQPQEVQLVA